MPFRRRECIWEVGSDAGGGINALLEGLVDKMEGQRVAKGHDSVVTSHRSGHRGLFKA